MVSVYFHRTRLFLLGPYGKNDQLMFVLQIWLGQEDALL